MDLGEQEYQASLAVQSQIVQYRKSDRLPDCLLFVQYPHTITLGRSGKIEHLLAPGSVLVQRGVRFYETDRGGDITYHGPGQLVAYPIIDLKQHRRDIHWYLRSLEACVIETLASYGIVAGRVAGATGVWVGSEKIAAIGVRTSQWVTSHGVALNVTPDLSFFDLMIPCGLAGSGVTSMARLLRSQELSLGEVQSRFCRCFGKTFSRRLRPERLRI